MKKRIFSLAKDTSYYLTNYFPIAFCLAVCMDSKAIIGVIISCLFIIFTPEIKTKGFMPFLISFFILGLNPEYTLGASIICAVLLIITSFFFDKLKNIFNSPAVSGIMLSGALTATVIFTTDYFGIGATGLKVTEMIKSYVSLGFHPNWRGVLYGTIVLVVMITFPRKFKKFNKYFSASFVALIITLILNLFLNPSFMKTAITELDFGNIEWMENFVFSDFNFNYKSVIIGLSLFIINFYSLTLIDSNRNGMIASSIVNIFTSGIFKLPLPYSIHKNIKSIIPRLISVALIIITFIVFKDTLTRIPLHSCAVVIIVTAWNSVKWSELKSAFSGVLPFICFVTAFTISIVTDLSVGITISFIVSVIYSQIAKKNKI